MNRVTAGSECLLDSVLGKEVAQQRTKMPLTVSHGNCVLTLHATHP